MSFIERPRSVGSRRTARIRAASRAGQILAPPLAQTGLLRPAHTTACGWPSAWLIHRPMALAHPEEGRGAPLGRSGCIAGDLAYRAAPMRIRCARPLTPRSLYAKTRRRDPVLVSAPTDVDLETPRGAGRDLVGSRHGDSQSVSSEGRGRQEQEKDAKPLAWRSTVGARTATFVPCYGWRRLR